MPKTEFLVRWDLIRAGQVSAHKDSIYEYKVYSDRPEAQVKTFCTTILEPYAGHEAADDKAQFNGSCSFPYGLESFYAFRKLAENTYYFIVCRPYTG